MTFDSNRAWKEASAAISANKDVLLALAGVFFMLPTLIVGLLFPQPEPAQGLDNDAMLKVLTEYYATTLPLMIPMTIVQMTGTLAMLTIFTDRTRPTVGEAIRQGAVSVIPYILAQLLFGMALGLVGTILLMIAAATGSGIVGGIVVIALVVMVLYALVKTSLVSPVVAVERERNPVAALKRSWQLTKGNSVRIALFYALVGVAFLVVMIVAMGLSGLILALVGGPESVRVGNTVVSSALWAVMSLYFVGIVAAVHRQLAGPSGEATSEPFE